MALLLAACGGKGEAVIAENELNSPGGDLQLKFCLLDGGAPAYTLDYKGQKVIELSRLGFDLTR